MEQIESPFATVTQEEAQWGLSQLDLEVKACTRCPELSRERTQTVFGKGNARPQLCLIGEAPGAHEDRLGEPFVGDAGELLTRILAAVGLSRDEVYILNTLKCRPPGNRAPTPEEIIHCQPFLKAQLKILQPQVICCLGATAAHALLDIQDQVGNLREQKLDYNGIPVVCTYHPAYLLRAPEKKREVWHDMQQMVKILGRSVSTKRD